MRSEHSAPELHPQVFDDDKSNFANIQHSKILANKCAKLASRDSECLPIPDVQCSPNQACPCSCPSTEDRRKRRDSTGSHSNLCKKSSCSNLHVLRTDPLTSLLSQPTSTHLAAVVKESRGPRVKKERERSLLQHFSPLSPLSTLSLLFLPVLAQQKEIFLAGN